MFHDKIISRKSNIHGPPQGSDFSPLHYWLWGRLQSFVNERNPTTITDIKLSVEMGIGSICAGEVKRAVINFRKRLLLCEDENGGRFQYLL